MNITYILTTFKEEKTISNHLSSLLKQSLLPNEIIIVDACSTDNTVKKIENWKKNFEKKGVRFSVILAPGNRSKGRNIAVSRASYQIIACSDADCIMDKRWLEYIVEPFKNKDIDVVSGFYKPITKTAFQKALAAYTCTMPDKLNPKTFLPSSRSIAFRKKAWENVKGYPEDLDTCEDLIFDKKLKQSGATFHFQENAFVWWPQRTNFWQAAKQFFSYATGDGRAFFFRKQTPLLYARVLGGLSLLSLYTLLHKNSILYILGILCILYVLWGIFKNYKYVNSVKAAFLLPTLQFVSDIAVFVGMTLGMFQRLIPQFVSKIQNNKAVTLLVFFFVLVSISQWTWGIPNTHHPFNYNMDEWAQAASLRFTFKYGTPHIHGGNDGTVFFYIPGGILVLLGMIFHVVNPFLVKSPLLTFSDQQRFFEVIRFQSVLYGIGSIILMYIIAKKFLKTSGILASSFLAITPMFLMLSIYYRHDIAVLFWIVFSLFFLFRYGENPTQKNFLVTGIIVGLTIATKISSVPLALIYILAFFVFAPHWLKHVKTLVLGVGIVIITFILTGIPDALISFGQFVSWIKVVLDQNVYLETTMFGLPYRVFYILYFYPSLFGKFFYVFFFGNLLFFFYYFFALVKNKFKSLKKQELFLIVSTWIIILSLISLKTQAVGARMQVLLPFIALLSSLGFKILARNFSGSWIKKGAVLLFGLIILYQTGESISWVTTRWFPSSMESSSNWIIENIPKGSTVGIELVPIFESIPDILLKDYYSSVYFPTYKSVYQYRVVDSKTSQFPEYIIMSNNDSLSRQIADNFHGQKTVILKKIAKLHYKELAKFSPNLFFFHMFNQDIAFFNGLEAMPLSTTIYKKQ